MIENAAGLRVLLAEDELLAALVVAEALTEMGHQVVHAADGAAALDLAAAQPFDVLVTDLAMPRLPGAELIRRLRAGRPDLPVVVMTGYLTPEAAGLLAGRSQGRTALLLKPFALAELAEALARIAAAAPLPLAC